MSVSVRSTNVRITTTKYFCFFWVWFGDWEGGPYNSWFKLLFFYIDSCSFITDISSGTNNEFSSTVPSRLQKPFVNLWHNFTYFNFYSFTLLIIWPYNSWVEHLVFFTLILAQKLLCFIEMQDGGRRQLGFGHFTFDVNVELCTAQSILMSSVVKIGAMVPKLQCFF